ncbi:MAG: hypothetical protein Q9162_006731 [Coniocarpon cinnabarinum]
MAYISKDPALLETLREEVRPAITSSSSAVDLSQALKSCPKLNSLYQEIIRITAVTSSHRQSATEHRLPSGRVIQPRTELLLVYQEMLKDKDLFGNDADQFKWDRFVQHQELARPPIYRPFGGGIGHCPGRFLAHSEVISMVALLITRYDIDATITNDRIPDLDTRMPPVGMGGPVLGQEMMVQVVPRSAEERLDPTFA